MTQRDQRLINPQRVSGPELMQVLQEKLKISDSYHPKLVELTGLPLNMHESTHGSGPITDSNLKKVQSFCAPCHAQKSNPSVPGFLAAASEAEMRDLLRQWRESMIKRIESNDMPMPPKRSPQGQAMTPEDREAVKNFLLSL